MHLLIGDCKDFKSDVQLELCKSQPTDDKPSLIGAWSRHVIHFKFQGPKHTAAITSGVVVPERTGTPFR